MKTNAQTCTIMKLKADALPPVAPVTEQGVEESLDVNRERVRCQQEDLPAEGTCDPRRQQYLHAIEAGVEQGPFVPFDCQRHGA